MREEGRKEDERGSGKWKWREEEVRKEEQRRKEGARGERSKGKR